MRFAWAKGSGNWAGVWRDGNTTEAMRLSGLTGYIGYRWSVPAQLGHLAQETKGPRLGIVTLISGNLSNG